VAERGQEEHRQGQPVRTGSPAKLLDLRRLYPVVVSDDALAADLPRVDGQRQLGRSGQLGEPGAPVFPVAFPFGATALVQGRQVSRVGDSDRGQGRFGVPVEPGQVGHQDTEAVCVGHQHLDVHMAAGGAAGQQGELDVEDLTTGDVEPPVGHLVS